MSKEQKLLQGKSTEIDPLFTKSPDDARYDTIEEAFSWGETNQVIGQHIWNRAREYERNMQGASQAESSQAKRNSWNPEEAAFSDEQGN